MGPVKLYQLQREIREPRYMFVTLLQERGNLETLCRKPVLAAEHLDGLTAERLELSLLAAILIIST